MDLKEAAIYNIYDVFNSQKIEKSNGSKKDGYLVSSDEPSIINIPIYQRPYRWASPSDTDSPEYIEKLFEDYLENGRTEYFIGSTVFVDKTSEGNSCKKFDVIDGQQRLTTLYLINYVRFLILREIVLIELTKSRNRTTIGKTIENLNKCFSSLVCTNQDYFGSLLENIQKINSDYDDQKIDQEKEAIDRIKNEVAKELFINALTANPEETIKRKKESIKSLLEKVDLSLTYSRPLYNNVLKEALSSVYLSCPSETYKYSLVSPEPNSNAQSNECPFLFNYTCAIQQIFDQLSKSIDQKEVDENTELSEIAQKQFYLQLLEKSASNMLEQLSVCVVISSNEKDANKLFEVLNDRALDVSDLELMKNRFYMEYCTKSCDDDEKIDEIIVKSEEIWNNAFNLSVKEENKLISFIGTVYLTGSTNLTYKSSAKLVDELSKKYFTVEKKEYNSEQLKKDFNVFVAVKLILEEAGIFYQNKRNATEALKLEKEPSSYIKKTLCLLMAMEYHGVLPALIDPIITYYQQINKNDGLAAEDFSKRFSTYIKKLFDPNEGNFKELHDIAKNIWVATMCSKDSKLVKKLADLYIVSSYKNNSFDIPNRDSKKIKDDLQRQFFDWLGNWSYNKKDRKQALRLKILFFRLMLLNRKDSDFISNNATVTFENGYITNSYIKNVEDLELDHLEANNPGDSPYVFKVNDDPEARNKYISELGNFMILDAIKNNSKNNQPIAKAIFSEDGYYKDVSKSWMVQEIKCMLRHEVFADFDVELKNKIAQGNSQSLDDKEFINVVPKAKFFDERTRRLKKYFIALIDNISGNDNGTFQVDLGKTNSLS